MISRVVRRVASDGGWGRCGRNTRVYCRVKLLIMNCSTASLAKELKFEGIKTISGSIEFDFNYGKNNDGEDQNIESVSFPELVHITGKVTVKQTRGLTSVSLEKLTNATTIIRIERSF